MLINSMKKYSPKTLDDFVFPNDEAKEIITAYASGEIEQPLILYGSNGSGKTLLQRLIPNAIEGFEASVQMVNCADLKSASDIHDLYGRNKHFNRAFTVNGQRYNYVIFEEFLITNKKIIDALKIEIDQTLGTDLTMIATNRFDKIDYGILSRSIALELQPCAPHVFFPHARRILDSERVAFDDAKLLKCLEVTHTIKADNRKYYEALDRIFRSV